MEYVTTSINESPVISAQAGAELEDVRGKAVKFDANDRIVLAGAGEEALGVAIISNDETIPEGGDLDIQLWAIGFVKAGAAFKSGDTLSSDANGAFKPAESGDAYIAIALQAAAPGTMAQAVITHGRK